MIVTWQDISILKVPLKAFIVKTNKTSSIICKDVT